MAAIDHDKALTGSLTSLSKASLRNKHPLKVLNFIMQLKKGQKHKKYEKTPFFEETESSLSCSPTLKAFSRPNPELATDKSSFQKQDQS